MSGKTDTAEWQGPPQVPSLGALVVDIRRAKPAVFRGVTYGHWHLRPVTGGTEWTVDPDDVRPATPEERIHAKTARANARSRGELL